MTPVAEALAAVLLGIEPVRDLQFVGLRQLAGRVAGDDVLARRTQPDFDASAMDGYAVRAADTEPLRPLRMIGESAAGRGFDGAMAEGECVRIFTGAALPRDADSVVLQEDADRTNDLVTPRVATVPGRHVRPRGNDFCSGDVLVRAGTLLRPASIALVASGGYREIAVRRRPRVGLLATGDELVLPGEPVGPHQIVASNAYGIAALAEMAGAEVLDFGIVADRPDLLRHAIADALASELDILVTVGGASVGDHDLVAPALRDCGVTPDFMRVAMRPGKPLMAGRIDRTRVLGLPGNPASSLVTATVFLVPMIRALVGLSIGTERRVGRLARDLPPNDHRMEFMRARVAFAEGDCIVDPLPRQDSSLLTIFAEADVLLIRPAHAGGAAAGEVCEYLPLA